MFSTTLVPLMLALSVVAAPAAPATAFKPGSGASVNLLKNVTVPIPAGSSLAAPAAPVEFVGLGVGIQNYTCTAGAYVSTGAVAELVDISCMVSKAAAFAAIPDIAMAAWSKAPASLTAQKLISMLSGSIGPVKSLGQHYFITNPVTGTGISPVWDFKASQANAQAFVVAAKTGAADSPQGTQNVPWLSLASVAGQGSLATQIYRTDTRLGQPPATCTVGTPDISVKYVSKYYLLGGTIKV
ncbi:hypothetical protein C8J56DRAFT_898471 [Mycena floridula]|nr:hypothetical protein C8J56DRAFT_898471 [Mycena floridula]